MSSSPAELLSHEDFLFFKEKIFVLTGIDLSERKRDLVQSRLRTELRERNIPSFHGYRKLIESAAPKSSELQQFINLLTTNKTDFFREVQHFEILARQVRARAEAIAKGGRVHQFNVWCCASSTGEEPYTLAIVLKHYLPAGFDFRIFASDIDTDVLRRGANGVYPLVKLENIPSQFRADAVTLGQGPVKDWFRIREELHGKVIFQQHNLISDPCPGEEKFDFIFCRNVLIYFSEQTIRVLMEKLHRALASDGLLFIGHSETIKTSAHLFQTVEPAVFSKVAA